MRRRGRRTALSCAWEAGMTLMSVWRMLVGVLEPRGRRQEAGR
jgi:hypothetical protein